MNSALQNAHELPVPEERTRVSSSSLFSDHVWVLDAPHAGQPPRSRTMNWNVHLGKSGRLTDPIFSLLLRSSKRFIWYLLVGHATRGLSKASTIMRHFVALRVFLRWMASKGISRFADLTQSDIDEYTAIAIRTETARGSEPGDETVYQRLYFLKYLIELGVRIEDAPDVYFPIEALEGLSRAACEPIPFIPDDISAAIYSRALQWLDAADDLIELWYFVRKARAQYSHLSTTWRNAHVREQLRSLDHTLRIPEGPLHSKAVDIHDLKRMLTVLNTACYVIVAGLTGMRISEVSSLNVGCLDRVVVDGMPTFVLNGRLIKTAVISTDRERWIAGPAEDENPVARAVSVLERLWAEDRRDQQVENLFTNCDTSIRLNRLTQPAINHRLQKFIDDIPGVQWRISSHQFRKTFARYVARAETMAPLALKRHFKHVDIQMTAHYIGTDLELVSDVVEARALMTEEILNDVLGADRLGGKMGEELARRNSQFRGISGRDAREQQIRLLMDNTDLVVVPHRYGVCFYRRDVARCQGDRSKIGVNTCVGCKNFIVGERHLDYWKGRREQLIRFRDETVDANLTHRVEALNEQINDANRVIDIIEGI